MLDYLEYFLLPPGELIYKELIAGKENKKDFARAVNISHAYLDGLVIGRYPLTERVAKAIEDHWGVSSDFLMRIEKKYRETIERRKRAGMGGWIEGNVW